MTLQMYFLSTFPDNETCHIDVLKLFECALQYHKLVIVIRSLSLHSRQHYDFHKLGWQSHALLVLISYKKGLVPVVVLERSMKHGGHVLSGHADLYLKVLHVAWMYCVTKISSLSRNW